MPRARVLVTMFASLALARGCGNQSSLGGDDQDGVVGGTYAFEVRVGDDALSPAILETQNLADVTVALTNVGTRPHGFRVQCLGTHCFPAASKIAPIPPQATATTTFRVPYPEGIYDVDDANAGGPTGQFIVQ